MLTEQRPIFAYETANAKEHDQVFSGSPENAKLFAFKKLCSAGIK